MRRALFGLDAQWHGWAYLSNARVDTTDCHRKLTTDGTAGRIHTSRRCRTFFTNMFPSAAKPLTAKTALSVLKSQQWLCN